MAIRNVAATADKPTGSVYKELVSMPAATADTPGAMRQAAYVDPSTATAQQVAQALIDAGIMAPASD